MVDAAALVAVISGAESLGHAAVVPGQSRSAHPHAARALEPASPAHSSTATIISVPARTLRNPAEFVTVNAPQFGLVFTDTIDAAAYAQPLYVPNVAIPNLGTHNVVYRDRERQCVRLRR